MKGMVVIMYKILAIGNSFSQDATAYLHDIAAVGGTDTKIVNLYIGGCSLKTHWENAESDHKNYLYELNGSSDGRMVSIREVLTEDHWDFITLQQASHDSGKSETYQPYLSKLSSYVRQYAPGAKQLLHETWAYEIDSVHPAFAEHYHNNQNEMYHALRCAYLEAANQLAVPMIPCGDVIQALRKTAPFDYANGGISLCRDGFHMNIPYGRYVLGAVWYETMLHGSIAENSYLPPEAQPDLIAFLKSSIPDLLQNNRAR